jgi:hypothetical protein
MRIIQPNHALEGSEIEKTALKLPSTNIHTLLALAKLVQTIQSQAEEEIQNAPHSPSERSAEPSAKSQSVIPMAPAHAPSTEPTGSSAGTTAEAVSEEPRAAENGGAA